MSKFFSAKYMFATVPAKEKRKMHRKQADLFNLVSLIVHQNVY